MDGQTLVACFGCAACLVQHVSRAFIISRGRDDTGLAAGARDVTRLKACSGSVNLCGNLGRPHCLQMRFVPTHAAENEVADSPWEREHGDSV